MRSFAIFINYSFRAAQAVESFSANTTDIGAALRKFSRRLQDTELPNDVPATQAVLVQQSQDYAALKTELRNANAQGETLLNLIKKPTVASTANPGPAAVIRLRNDPWPGQLVNVTTVERLIQIRNLSGEPLFINQIINLIADC